MKRTSRGKENYLRGQRKARNSNAGKTRRCWEIPNRLTLIGNSAVLLTTLVYQQRFGFIVDDIFIDDNLA